VLLNTIDAKWKDHLHAVDALKQGIGLRGYAQKDPKNEYKAEAFHLFEKLFASIEDEVASLVLRLRVSGEERLDDAGSVFGGAAEPANTNRTAEVVETGRGAAVRGATAVATPAAKDGAKPEPKSAAPRNGARPPTAHDAFDRARKSGAIEPSPAKSAKPIDPRFANVMRNDDCPCGSGKKFKKCHGAT
jgi:preprotein translocase subunit SecA